MNKRHEQTTEAEAPGTDLTQAQAAGTALATVDFGDDAGAGMENVTSDELKVPVLVALGANSPQVVKPADQGGLPNAKAGMIYNTATGDLYDGKIGITIIPVHRDHNYPEFIPRNIGGGLVAIYPPDDPYILDLRAKAKTKFGKLSTVTKRNEKNEPLDGTELQETRYIYVLAIDPVSGFPFRAVVRFKSSQIPKYQTFMQRTTSFKYNNPRSTTENPLPPQQPPMYAHKWRLCTVYETKKDFSWYGWALSLEAKNPDGTEKQYPYSLLPQQTTLYAEAKAFSKMLAEGKATADIAGAAQAEAETEEVPF